MKAKRNIDWLSIEKAYRGGIQSIRQISRTYGVSDKGISKRATRDGWTRDLSAAVRQKARELVVRKPGSQEPPVDQDDAVNEEATVAANIIRGQRTDIAEMRQYARDLVKDIKDITGKLNSDPEMNDDARVKLIRLRADIYRDLAQAMAKIVPLERIAFSLDAESASAEDLATALLELKSE